MSLVPEIKRVPLQYKLKLKAEINLLISKYQNVSQIDSNQLYHQSRPQSNSPYNQILSNTYIQNQSTDHYYHQHFSPTQPTTYSVTQGDQTLQYNQSNITVTSDFLTQDHSQSTSTNTLQRSPYDLSSIHTS